MPTRNAPAIDVGDVRGHVGHGRHFAGAEQAVAVVQARDHQVVQIGREDQRDAEQREEIAEDDALLALGRIDRGDEAEAELLRDHRTRGLQRRDREPRRHAEHQADQQLLAERHDDGAGRAQVDGVAGAVQREHHEGEHQRDGEPHAHRHAALAEARQQHDHGAEAREHQDEGGAEGGKEGDVELHAAACSLRMIGIMRSGITRL